MEGGGGGGAGEGVAGDVSITQSHRWRGPGEGHLSLSSIHKHLWSTCWSYEHIVEKINIKIKNRGLIKNELKLNKC